MSKNSKMTRKLRQAKNWSEQRKSGNPGPSETTPSHGKKNTWYGRKDGKYQGKESTKRKRGGEEGDE